MGDLCITQTPHTMKTFIIASLISVAASAAIVNPQSPNAVEKKEQIQESVVINATPQQVWAVLTDLESYKEWNPFIIEAKGKVVLGEKLAVSIKPQDKPWQFSPKVVVADSAREFTWLGKLWGIGGLVNGRHRFVIEDMGNGQVRLVQSESFKGILAWMMKGMEADTRKGFQKMNEALKQRVEARR